ncbi:MAG: hypothetical protein DRR19_29885 [Candidatus Parabeggiatoa sp. nov. 1]|nr:MAG: hypothetical protein DRR19_29885 [Gammaproteobacteria bacterium]
MKKRTKLQAAILAALASSPSYADYTCLPPDAGSKSPLEVFQCFEAKLSGQQQQMGGLAAANQNQQLRIVELEKANQRLRQKTDAISVSSDGNVGIGTMPGAKLDVAGLAQVDYLTVNPQGGSIEGGEIRLDGAGAFTTWYYDNYRGRIRWHHSGAEYVTINEIGNVGIGTIPTEKLQVNGNVKATAFKTGDIFFEKDGETLWQMFEDEHGLYVKHLKTGHTYRFVLEKIQ